jgi:uncharacterized protein YqeY
MAEEALKDRIRDDMNAARRQQDKDRARLLSTLLSDIRNREIEVRHELEDGEVVEVLARAVKLRNEAAEQMASRPELADRERAEATILKAYMPPQLSGEEIRSIVQGAIDAGAQNIGAVMGRVMPEVKGRADGREVNRIVREVLQSKGSGG